MLLLAVGPSEQSLHLVLTVGHVGLINHLKVKDKSHHGIKTLSLYEEFISLTVRLGVECVKLIFLCVFRSCNRYL